MNVQHHRRSRVYLSHLIRVFRPRSGGIGIVIWRHEFTLHADPTPTEEPRP